MFDKFIIHKQDNEALTAAISKGSSKLSETIEAANDKEIKARDRVNISLEEYNKLVAKVRILETENSNYRKFFKVLGVPYDLPIIPESAILRKELSSPLSIDTQKYQIEFDVRINELNQCNW